MKVKICGITNLEDALLAINLGADAVGFIFYEKSKRYIQTQKAAEIISQLPPFVFKVGVFVNESIDQINNIAETAGLNAIQLHGDECPEFAGEIKLPVIKSIRVRNSDDINIIEQYPNCSSLLDSFDKEFYGGTGANFNWDLIPDSTKGKIILAGGVSTENIEKIFYEIKPYAVDLSSSVEEFPGKKSVSKMKDFFSKVNKLRGNKC